MAVSSLSVFLLVGFAVSFLPLLDASALPPGYGDENVFHRKVRCRSRMFRTCYNVWKPCPAECPSTCFLDCTLCKAVCRCNVPGALCQDPRFIGSDGVTFYFHGRMDKDFCIVSDKDFHINAHFIGKRNPNLKRDFTWVRSLGIISDNRRLLIGAAKTSMWDSNDDHLVMSLDNAPIEIPKKEGQSWKSQSRPTITITRTSNVNSMSLEYEGKFKVDATVVPITKHESRIHGYNISDDDCFAHLELGFKFFNLTDTVDGVLGQTYAKGYISKVRVGANMPVMGGTHRYTTPSLFSTDCEASRYGKSLQLIPAMMEDEGCKSGIRGTGVVCKK
ncbi:hypothetical protein MLD38_038044 [Melastoma candidum]|uniref:Uncharacterized protein n=1 Tax=Melastoma candidum TaxID=119954 RepID=A0ACB9KYI7_9MYRT|nr:hypothetical protein MLD38_038044 [Melastoma candidum]